MGKDGLDREEAFDVGDFHVTKFLGKTFADKYVTNLKYKSELSKNYMALF